MIDLLRKTSTLFAESFSGMQIQCIVGFPDFDEALFPLVLIKEQKLVLILNITSKDYIKVADIDTEDEADWACN